MTGSIDITHLYLAMLYVKLLLGLWVLVIMSSAFISIAWILYQMFKATFATPKKETQNMELTSNLVHSMDLPQINDELVNFRHDRTLEIGGIPTRVSFIPFLQTIVYTGLGEGSHHGTIYLNRPFASKTPADFLLENEINHHIDTQGE